MSGTTSIPPDRIAVETPEVLLEPLAAHLAHLAELADATEVHFDHYYRPVIARLGTFLQQLPASSGRSATSLLESRLIAAESALRRRRGYFLPPGAEPETLVQEADLWSYVIFTLSLFQGLGVELSSIQVELFDQLSQTLRIWKPWRGPMAEQGVYSYRAERIDTPVSIADWTPLLLPYLMPRQGHEWLWSNRSVLKVWLEILNGSTDHAVIHEILSPHRENTPVT
jgi:hypothetical protein